MSKYSKKLAETKPQAAPKLAHTPPEIAAAWQLLRRTQLGLAGALVLLAVGGLAFPTRPSDTQSMSGYMPVILASFVMTFAYTTHSTVIRPALEELRRNPFDHTRVKQWRSAVWQMQALCALVGLGGFATQVMHVSQIVAFTLYAIAIVYLFVLRPQHP